MDPVVLSYVFINTHYKSEAATTVAYHFRIVRLDIIKKTDNSKWWQDCEKIELLYTLQVRYKMIQLLLKTFWHFLNNVNVKLPLCPSTFTPSYLPKRNKNTHSNKNWARMFIAALFTIAQKKTAQKTISWWMDKKKKMHRKKWDTDTCPNTDKPRNMWHERSQSQKTTYYMKYSWKVNP